MERKNSFGAAEAPENPTAERLPSSQQFILGTYLMLDFIINLINQICITAHLTKTETCYFVSSWLAVPTVGCTAKVNRSSLGLSGGQVRGAKTACLGHWLSTQESRLANIPCRSHVLESGIPSGQDRKLPVAHFLTWLKLHLEWLG